MTIRHMGRTGSSEEAATNCPPTMGGVVRRRRLAFTMVEMLVVISVIGVLMGLLLPAISTVRENARFTRCLNNQGELAKGVIQYETAKQQFPGYIESIGQFPIGWLTMMLPYVGRAGLFHDWEAWFRLGPLKSPWNTYALAVYIDQFKCPSDAGKNVAYPLSYVANCGLADSLTSRNPPDWRANGVFFSHDPRLPPERLVTITTAEIKDGASHTIMLSENIQAGYWTEPFREVRPPRSVSKGMPEYGYGFDSTPPNQNWKPPHVEGRLGIIWFADANSGNVTGRRINDQARFLGTNEAFVYARPSSYHTGAVAATFCDGHTRRIRDTIEYRLYAQMMSSCDREIKLAGSTRLPTLPPEWYRPITDADIE